MIASQAMKTIHTQPGQLIQSDERGDLVATLEQIRRVGIADLAQVHSHSTTRVAGFTSHVVHFIGGGLLCYAYNERGKLIELSGRHLCGSLNPQNDLIFSAIDHAAEP